MLPTVSKQLMLEASTALVCLAFAGLTAMFCYYLVKYLAFGIRHGRKPQPWER